MMNPQFSDEPTRVTQLIRRFMSKQSGSVISPEEELSVRLRVGADGRDDCAVYDIDDPLTLVAGSDYVRGPKFTLYELGLLSNFDLGYYLVVANVSDIAAMGAAPIGLLTVVRYPESLDDDSFLELMAGIHQAATDFGTMSVGGDIGQAERIILSASALGVCHREKVLLRSGSQVDDLLCITGPCGVLGAAMAYFPQRERNQWVLPEEIESQLIGSWKRPQARVVEGRILARKPFATACQDTSDGLKATIEQIAEASEVGFDVWADSVPIDDAVAAVADLLGIPPITLAMSASADFQLLFTVTPDDVESCRQEFADHGLSFTVIGRATDRNNDVACVDGSGTSYPLPGVAWRHQSSDISTLVTDGQGSNNTSEDR